MSWNSIEDLHEEVPFGDSHSTYWIRGPVEDRAGSYRMWFGYAYVTVDFYDSDERIEAKRSVEMYCKIPSDYKVQRYQVIESEGYHFVRFYFEKIEEEKGVE